MIARRVIHEAPPEKITIMLSTRFRHQELDGDVSEKANALEVAIDSHWSVYSCVCLAREWKINMSSVSTVFLSSSEAQDGALAMFSNLGYYLR